MRKPAKPKMKAKTVKPKVTPDVKTGVPAMPKAKKAAVSFGQRMAALRKKKGKAPKMSRNSAHGPGR